MNQFEKQCNRISFETLYGASIAGSIPVEVGDFEFFGFDMGVGVGVDPFGVNTLAFTFDLKLALAIREEGGVNVWIIT